MSKDQSNRSRTGKRTVKAKMEHATTPAAAQSDGAALRTRLIHVLNLAENRIDEVSVSEDSLLRPQIERASGGSWREALSLLEEFATEGPSANPLVVGYVADRIKVWLAADCGDRKARRAFLLARPSQREPSDEVQDKHIRFIENYLILRGEGLDRGDALGTAAKNVYLDVKTVEPLIKGLRDPKAAFTQAQVMAIRRIVMEPFFPDYSGPERDDEFLKRCLGRGWAKWKSHTEAREKTFATLPR